MPRLHARWFIDWYLTSDAPSLPVERWLRAHIAQCEACKEHYDTGVRLLRLARGGPDVHGLGEKKRLSRRASLAPMPPPAARAGRLRVLFAAIAMTAVLVFWILVPASVGRVLLPGDELRIDGERAVAGQRIRQGSLLVAAHGDAVIALVGDRDVLLREGAAVRVTQRGSHASLELGRARFVVHRLGERPNPFAVIAGSTQVDVQGTTFVVDRRDPKETLVAVKEGHVRVQGAKGEVRLTDGQETSVANGVPGGVRPASAASLEEDGGNFLELLLRRAGRLVKDVERAVRR